MKLSITQKKILTLLSENCRYTFRDIAASIRMSPDGVGYQVKTLLHHHHGATPYVQFDYRMIGYDHYHIWIRLKDLSYDINALADIPCITSINTNIGYYDLQLIIVAQNKKSKDHIIQRLHTILAIDTLHQAQFSTFIKPFSCIIPPIYHPVNRLYNKKNSSYQVQSQMNPPTHIIKLEPIDRKIIHAIITNPMGSYTSWAKAADCSIEVIRYRVKKYITQRFITQFGLLHNFTAHQVITGYLVCSTQHINLLTKLIASDQHIFYAAHLDGQYNCILYICAPSHHTLNTIALSIRQNVPCDDLQLLLLDTVTKYIQFPQDELLPIRDV